MPARVVYLGTPHFAVPALDALVSDPRVDVRLVVSQPARPVGRGRRLTDPPVALRAREHGIPCVQPERVRDEAPMHAIRETRPDLCVVAAFGQILRPELLDLPPAGCLNLHASLLPAWRGAAPIAWAVASGDAVSGVSLMRMERGLDTGPVYAMAATMIGETETAEELHDRLSTLGAELLVRELDRILDGTAVPIPQAGSRSSYAPRLTAEQRRVDFAQPAHRVAAWINGMWPAPGARAWLGRTPIGLARAQRVVPESRTETAEPGSVLAADPGAGLVLACAEGSAISILEAQRPGGRLLGIGEFLRGFPIAPSSRLRAESE